jgi:hypothetical protein
MNTNELSDEQKDIAVRYYLLHKKCMKEYNQKNKDLTKIRNQKYQDELKENPEKRQKYLEKKKDYYYTHTKPKLEAKKKEKKNIEIDHIIS